MSSGCVTAQTFVEIEENIFFSFFSLLCEREVEENEEGQWNKESSCIFFSLFHCLNMWGVYINKKRGGGGGGGWGVGGGGLN